MEIARTTSPLIEKLPEVSSEIIGPLVLSFCDRVGALDFSLRTSRITVAEMFIGVIESVSELILEIIKDIVMKGRPTGPLEVSEEAVRKAVHPSLCQSFKNAVGMAHRYLYKLSSLVCDEVTNWVKSSLCRSRVNKNGRLVIKADQSYKPARDTLKYMISLAKEIFCLGCKGNLSPEDEEPSTSVSQLETPRQIFEGILNEQEDIVEMSSEIIVSTSVPQWETPYEIFERIINLKEEKDIDERANVSCVPQMETPREIFEGILKEEVDLDTASSPIGVFTDEALESQSESFENIQEQVDIETTSTPISQVPSQIDTVQLILDGEVSHLCRGLTFVSEETASSIVEQMLDQRDENLWTEEDFMCLTYEVCRKVLGENIGLGVRELCQNVMQEMRSKSCSWDIKIEPSYRNIKNVAEAVYRELCKKQGKKYVRFCAMFQEYDAKIIDTIQKNLETPPPEKRTFGSCLRAVWAFCRGR